MLVASFCCVPKSPWQVSICELSNHTSSTNSRVPRARVLGQSQSPPANLPQGQGRSFRHRVLGCMAVQSWDCLQSSSFLCYPRRCYLCTIWDSQPGLILQHIEPPRGWSFDASELALEAWLRLELFVAGSFTHLQTWHFSKSHKMFLHKMSSLTFLTQWLYSTMIIDPVLSIRKLKHKEIK